jgi:cobalt-zinc-cadmium efflux system membrane fusion protein
MKLVKALLLSGCLACAKVLADAENMIQLPEAHLNNLGVVIGKLTPVQQMPLLSAPAKVVIPPSHEYVVSASQSGLITKLNVAIGDKVSKGDILAQINSSDLLSTQRLYLKAKSELNFGSLSYQRDKKLLEQGVISERRWLETKSQYQAFASELDEHRQLLEIAGMSSADIARLSKTHRLSGQLNIYAPATGIVIERLAVAGERVDNLAPLYRIGVLDELWLEIAVPQERIGAIKIGDQVWIDNSEARANIIALGQSVNPENQSVLARALLNKKQDSLRAGQKVSIQIIQEMAGAFKIPNTGVVQHEGKSYVFIRAASGFQASPIEIIGKQGDESVIKGNLSGQETVALQGAVALKANWLGLGSDE